MHNDETLALLAERLQEIILDDAEAIVATLNIKKKLKDLFDLIGYKREYESIVNLNMVTTDKIVVIGQSSGASEALLRNACAEIGISAQNIEFYLNYEDGKKLNFEKFTKDKGYCAIMVGPVPHSGQSKGKYPSVITAIEHEPGYPKVVKLGENGLKLDKASFQKGMMELYVEGIIGNT